MGESPTLPGVLNEMPEVVQAAAIHGLPLAIQNLMHARSQFVVHDRTSCPGAHPSPCTFVQTVFRKRREFIPLMQATQSLHNLN